MQELIINRHNKAALMIHEAIVADSQNSDVSFTVLDACASDALPPGAHATRIPKWILPNTSDADRDRLRPDMLIIQGFTLSAFEQYSPAALLRPAILKRIQSLHHIRIVELTYTIESCYPDAMLAKLQQHLRLIHALQAAGWTIDDAPTPPTHPPIPSLPPHPSFPTPALLRSAALKTHIVILGSTGMIFRSSHDVLGRLGILPPSLTQLERRLHVHAVQYVGHIISHRRRLENLPYHSPTHTPPPLPPDPA
jgi:hypothetical protein